ncbi:MAG TPA: N-acetyl sugar amidotransferase [Pyrinomonadaceae bacterium]|nr:N-acetyl sugar amidotransferase [Pyrinomonadaceae bacterium]
MREKTRAKFGLPEEVLFCKKCVMSNQRPSSYPEFKHTRDRITPTLHIGEDGICDACRYAEKKEQIDWESRERELYKLLDRYRRNDGEYDCICPGSGGKDSAYAAYLLKYKYGMHPLTVTWPPTLYTDYGLQNFRNWIEIGGFDNISFKPDGRVHRLLTRLSIENLLHPFQTFILGQKNLAPKIAATYKVPLIFYGEAEAEYGNPIAETQTSLRDKSYYTMRDLSEIYLGGVSIPELMEKYNLSLNSLAAYLPADYQKLEESNIEVHYLGYYVKWTPQEAYYHAVEHTGFQARPHRTEGTYSKYNSIDDKIDDLHYYTTYIKFGLGRASYDASQEIRNKHLTREEGVALVHRFDGEFPERYFRDVMDYIEMEDEHFYELCDHFRSPHLWRKEDGEWKLLHRVS